MILPTSKQVNEELITKLEELEQMKRESKELEHKLADTVVEMVYLLPYLFIKYSVCIPSITIEVFVWIYS